MHCAKIYSTINQDGVNLFSSCSTQPIAEPSGSPTGLRIIQVGDTYVRCMWNYLRCEERNGPITGYKVQLYKSKDIVQNITLPGQESLTYTARDLDPCKHLYSIEVAAINDDGIGPYRRIEFHQRLVTGV